MCKNTLTRLDKENVDEIFATLDKINEGEFQIIKQEHLIKSMMFRSGPVAMGEVYNIEILYTCKLCENVKEESKICSFDNFAHDQICIKFKRKTKEILNDNNVKISL